MKLFAWLRRLLHRPTPDIRPSYRQPRVPSQQAANQPPPLLVNPPFTPIQLLVGALSRGLAIEQAAANLQAETKTQLPLELLQQNDGLRNLRTKLAEAQRMGWVADELHLILEVQLKIAQMHLSVWQYSLVEEFGQELGNKLGQHQIQLGMRLEHLLASFGPPPSGAVKVLTQEPAHLLIQYGNKATGSYFETVDGVVTVSRLGRPTLPPKIFDGLDIDE